MRSRPPDDADSPEGVLALYGAARGLYGNLDESKVLKSVLRDNRGVGEKHGLRMPIACDTEFKLTLEVQGFTISTTPGITPRGPLFTAESIHSQLRVTGVGNSAVAAIGDVLRQLNQGGQIKALDTGAISSYLDQEVVLCTMHGQRYKGTLSLTDMTGKHGPYIIEERTYPPGA